eukprot:GHRQ01015045.1.p3 GENE.GHRQ01015045.1~~GHRQ01015045.1.p3  ORF type:complete len:185 (+),score=49.55 GHRQ01015045.1:387-941(+)
MIFGNCISLAAYDPVNHDGLRNQKIAKIDLALNIAFTVEMVLRILSIGGVLAYLRHPWNAFDCVMVLAGYTTFIPIDASSGGSGLEGLKALRALRAMRPLRTITRFPALRSIVVCFLEAVPLLVSVAAMLLFFLFIFAGKTVVSRHTSHVIQASKSQEKMILRWHHAANLQHVLPHSAAPGICC